MIKRVNFVSILSLNFKANDTSLVKNLVCNIMRPGASNIMRLGACYVVRPL